MLNSNSPKCCICPWSGQSLCSSSGHHPGTILIYHVYTYRHSFHLPGAHYTHGLCCLCSWEPTCYNVFHKPLVNSQSWPVCTGYTTQALPTSWHFLCALGFYSPPFSYLPLGSCHAHLVFGFLRQSLFWACILSAWSGVMWLKVMCEDSVLMLSLFPSSCKDRPKSSIRMLVSLPMKWE